MLARLRNKTASKPKADAVYSCWNGFVTSNRVVRRGDRLPGTDPIVTRYFSCLVPGELDEALWPSPDAAIKLWDSYD